MGFPTADDIALFSGFLRLTGIRTLVTEARPELAEVSAVTGPPLALTIDLPTSASGVHNRVVLGRGRGLLTHWLIVGARGYELVSAVWDFESPDDQIRDALVATYDGCLAKSELASPWRWAEPFRSTVVRVAEGLTACGCSVDAVASTNRIIPDRVK